MRYLLPLAAFAAFATTAAAQQFTALTSTGSLYNFNATTPGTGTTVGVTGVTAGQTLVGIDFRPVDNALIGLGYNSATGAASLYTLNLSTGAAVSINNTLTLGVGLTRVMMDFNPTANAVRITTSGATGNNLRIPTGGTGAQTTDTDLNPANTGIRGSAYSRNQAGGGTNGATTLYLIDGTNNQIVSQGSIDFFTGNGTSPNTGTLTNVAALSGVTGSTVVGFDIFSPNATTSPGTGYLATGTSFYSFNLSTGAATLVGSFTGVTVLDIAGQVVPEPGSLALGAVGLGAFAAMLRRRVRRQG